MAGNNAKGSHGVIKNTKQIQDIAKEHKGKKDAPIIKQLTIFAIILFISGFLSSLFPKSFPVPAAVIGTILLYLGLTFKIIKIESVRKFAYFMISLIGFLFVPAGISLAANLKIMKAEGVQLVCVIIIATIVLLVLVCYTAKIIISIHEKISGVSEEEFEKSIIDADKE